MATTHQLDFSLQSARLREQIDAALSECAQPGRGCPDELCEAIRYSLLAPGKRLRPMLALMAAEACGGFPEAAMPAACAVEMVHAYSLIHDDLPAMDDDDLRRGRPTCHKKFGEAIAILAGDALLAMAFGAITRGVKPPETAAACCAALAEAAGPCALVGGQADDLAAERSGHSPTGIDALESIHLRKTGAMIRASLRLGALTAGAGDQQLAALDEYGRCLGLAFQITDDLLDVRSSEAATGKRVEKDARRGKLTYPGLLGIEESQRRALQLTEEACRAIGRLGPAAGPMEALARYVVERDR
jgi:geranylgeranyl diphosphate synthase, type II